MTYQHSVHVNEGKKMRARNGIRQARKGIKADKEWHKSRQGKVQRRKEKTKALNKIYKSIIILYYIF